MFNLLNIFNKNDFDFQVGDSYFEFNGSAVKKTTKFEGIKQEEIIVYEPNLKFLSVERNEWIYNDKSSTKEVYLLGMDTEPENCKKKLRRQIKDLNHSSFITVENETYLSDPTFVAGYDHISSKNVGSKTKWETFEHKDYLQLFFSFYITHKEDVEEIKIFLDKYKDKSLGGSGLLLYSEIEGFIKKFTEQVLS